MTPAGSNHNHTNNSSSNNSIGSNGGSTSSSNNVTMKSRLGRLLNVKSRFRKSTKVTKHDTDDDDVIHSSSSSSYGGPNHHHHHPIPDVEQISSTSSNASLSNHDMHSIGGTSSDDESTMTVPSIDVYADVRQRLEELSLRDRQRYCHDTPMKQQQKINHHRVDESTIPTMVAYFVYLSYAVLIFMGHIRDFIGMVLQRGRYVRKTKQGNNNNACYPSESMIQYYAPLLKSWENFYTRRLYSRIQDVFNRPIASNPGAIITVLERVSDNDQKSMKLLGPIHNLDTQQQQNEYRMGQHYIESYDGCVGRQCLNLGSYNYLGFADDWHVTCADDVLSSVQQYPVSVSSCRNEYGTTSVHRELEMTVAKFLNKEDALVLNMGFNTNATTIPALVGRNDLILSDELNHTSIVNGARASGAAIRTFRHNDMDNLESILREAVVMGRPRTRRPWNKIFVIVEGIYSMEGEYCDLHNVVRLCKIYGAYVYLDEAHSIGAMGPTGRGLSEYTGTNSADIDIMMGTFTKSFGGMGGYIAANKSVIDYLRQRCSASARHNALSPIVCQQVLTCFKVITGEDGTNIGRMKLQALRDNSNYFRMRLREMGLQVLGHYDSPIMPVMLYHPGKISGFSRECLKRGLAVVVVGFPAVPLLMSRARFCISAGHTREYLDRALHEINDIADILHLRYQPKNPDMIN